jgi:hypothetical protein
VEEYLCLTIRSKEGETAQAFKSRIISFWSDLCKKQPDLFESVYAETSDFEHDGGSFTRKYLVEVDSATEVFEIMNAGGLQPGPMDTEDVYSKYEAKPPEWFQIEH